MLGLLKAKVEPYLLLIKVVGVLLIVGSLAGYYLWSQSKINGLQADVNLKLVTISQQKKDIENISKINADNQKVLEAFLNDNKLQAEIRKSLADQKNQRDRQTNAILSEISKIDPKLNGPVAPVLYNTVDQLQQLDKERRGIKDE